MWGNPFGSGGHRVETGRPNRPLATSAATISRMKSVIPENTGEVVASAAPAGSVPLDQDSPPSKGLPSMRISPAPVWIAALSLAAASWLTAQEPVDQAVIARIREEGLQRSRVEQTFNQLTNVIGPRLTGTPAYKQAADWSATELKRYGLSAVHLESFPFGRGWTLEKLVLEMVEPWYFPLTGYPEAWSPSTKGELLGAPVYLGDLADSTAVRARAADLRGAIVLLAQPHTGVIVAARPQPSACDTAVRIGATPVLKPARPLLNQARPRNIGKVGTATI